MRRKIRPPDNEWSYLVAADTIHDDHESTYTLRASEKECTDLAARLDVVAIDDLEADLAISRERGCVLHVFGHVRARVTQDCVVTLAPVITDVDEVVDAYFADKDKTPSLTRARADRDHARSGEFPMLDEMEDPEPLIDGQVDLAETAAQFLSLGINPYPHAPGVTPVDKIDESPAADRPNPFAALKNWRDRAAESALSPPTAPRKK